MMSCMQMSLSNVGKLSYWRVRPLVVQLPPVEQLLPGLLWELPFLLFLRKLLPETAQVPTVLLQELVLELLISSARGSISSGSFSRTLTSMSSSEEQTPSDLPSADKKCSDKMTCFVKQRFSFLSELSTYFSFDHIGQLWGRHRERMAA
jgi:hypothetical protein